MPRKMKESDSQLLGLLPSNWECNVVRRYYNIMLGKMLCPEKLDESYSLEKYYCAANVHFDGVSDNGLKAMWFSPSEKREYGVREGDLLVVEGGAGAGGAAIAGRQRGFVGVQNSVMIVRPKKDADVRLLKYWLQVAVPSGYIDCVCNRATIPHFTKDKIGNMKIPYPPPAEQRRIAAYLDERCARIDGMIAEAKASIEDYKKWKQSIIFEAVTGKHEKNLKPSGIDWIGDVPEGWKVCAMKTVIDILPGYAFESEAFASSEGIRLLRGVNVSVDSLRWDETVYWNASVDDKLAAYLIKENDLIVGLDRPWISGGTRAVLAKESDLPCLLVQRVCRIRAKEGNDVRFLLYLLKQEGFEKELSVETTGVSVPHISTKQIENFKVPLPSVNVQRRIAAFLDEKCAAIDKLVGEKEALIADLEAYKKSLIFETVTGKREVA